MALIELQLLQGYLTLIAVIVSVVLGISIMLRYRKTRQRELLLVGGTWILLVSGYWPDVINFLVSLLNQPLIPDMVYLFLATAFYAPIHVMWMQVITELLYKDNQKKIMKFFWIEAVIYEIFLISMLLFDFHLVGEQMEAIGPFYAEFSPIVMGYFVFSLVLFVVTGILFARVYLKSTNKENRQKGYLLIAAFLCFLVGIALDNFVDPIEITIVIARIFHMAAAFEFYFGFSMRKSTS